MKRLKTLNFACRTVGVIALIAAWSGPVAAAAGASSAAAAADAKWQVERPEADTKNVTIDVSEGTWMSLDVSPDGRMIAFDLLGDIYEIPIEGGAARSVSSGMAWEMQPRYSPDGSTLAYISDSAGADNVWLHDRTTNKRRALTSETFRLLNNPSFSPDGRFVVARKHYTTGRSLGTGELWLYHVAGGSGQQLLARADNKHQKELGEPVFSPDGQSIYFSKDTTPGRTFAYAQDSNGQIFEILRLDLATGAVQAVVSGAGGAARPTPSPDGKQLAFVRRTRAKSGLWVKDLASGAERVVVADLDQDVQEVWAVHGVYPNMAWTPDASSIVYWAGGKLRRVAVDSGDVKEIAFSVKDTRRVVPVVRPQQKVFKEFVKTSMARSPVVSPDGQKVVFEALGRLYVKDLPDGRARRLTSDSARRFEFHPAFSADSRRVVFATWDDESLGSVRSVSARGGRSKAVSATPGHYVEPAFAADGKAVLVRNAGANALRDPRYGEAGIYWLGEGGDTRLLSKRGRRPHSVMSPAGFAGQNMVGRENEERIYFSVREADKTLLRSVDRLGGNARTHAGADFVTEFVLSPSGRFLAYRENYNIYAQPHIGFAVAAADAKELPMVGRDKKGLPNHKVSAVGGNYPNWSGDWLSFSLGAELFWLKGDELNKAPAGNADKDTNKDAKTANDEAAQPAQALDIASTNLSVSAAADAPSGRVLLSNARVITMVGDEVLENANVLVEGNKIVAVGAEPDRLPADVQRVDLTGKTIIPGLIDAHAHGSQGRTIIPEQNWVNYATLALGVTTVHDPSNDATSFFAASELQRTGRILAPRLFSTGDVVYGARSSGLAAIDSAEDALNHIKRLKAQGAGSIKNYNQPRRNQRQQVVAASQAENMLVVAEGGSLFHMDLSMVADGNATIEHNLPQSTLYEDVLQFWSQTEVAYTPTLVVTYGGLTAEHYWYQETDVWKHPLLSRYVPPNVLRPRSVRRQKAPLADYHHVRSATTATALARRGVMVSIGAHGQREGLASHWEIWGFAQGGMTPMEALRTATITPAKALGFAEELGSIETGKLADLVILDANPLEDIFRTDRVHKVMLNGRLYDAGTLVEEGTGSFAPRPFYWKTGE